MAEETTETGTAAAPAATQPAEVKRDFTDIETAKPEAKPEPVAAPSGATIEEQVVEDAATVMKEVEAAEAAPAKPEEDKAAEEAAKAKAEEAPKTETLSVNQARRQKQSLAKERDRKIAEQNEKIARLEAEKAALESAKVDTDTAENYDEAVQTNAVNTALGAQKAAEIEQAKQERATAAREAATQARNEFAERGKKIEGVKDFEDVVFKDDIPFTPDTVAALMEIDNGPAIAYDLATKPEKLAELNELSPTQRAIKLGQMSATHTAPKPAIETKAPEPIKPTEDGGGLTTGKPESEMSYAEMRASLGMNVDKPGYKSAS